MDFRLLSVDGDLKELGESESESELRARSENRRRRPTEAPGGPGKHRSTGQAHYRRSPDPGP